jgi:hypothetical protein
MNKTTLILILIGSIFLAGCYYDKEEELYPNSSTTSTTSTTAPVMVSYKNDIQQLMANNCATPGCHVTGAQSPDLSSYTGLFGSRAIVKDRANSVSNPMPSGGLMSISNRNLLNSWIDAGAPNN